MSLNVTDPFVTLERVVPPSRSSACNMPHSRAAHCALAALHSARVDATCVQLCAYGQLQLTNPVSKLVVCPHSRPMHSARVRRVVAAWHVHACAARSERRRQRGGDDREGVCGDLTHTGNANRCGACASASSASVELSMSPACLPRALAGLCLCAAHSVQVCACAE